MLKLNIQDCCKSEWGSNKSGKDGWNILFSLSMIGVQDPTRVLPILVLSVCCAAWYGGLEHPFSFFSKPAGSKGCLRL